MPRGRPRTRTAVSMPRIMMDIRPKTAIIGKSDDNNNNGDFPMPANLVKAPIFAKVLQSSGVASISSDSKDLNESTRNTIRLTEPIDDSSSSSSLAPLSITATPPPLIMTQIGSSPEYIEPPNLPLLNFSPKHKPFICFYCGFQCDTHLMRHRCVPKRAKKRRIAPAPSTRKNRMDEYENSTDHGNVESEAAEILTEMLKSGVS